MNYLVDNIYVCMVIIKMYEVRWLVLKIKFSKLKHSIKIKKNNRRYFQTLNKENESWSAVQLS